MVMTIESVRRLYTIANFLNEFAINEVIYKLVRLLLPFYPVTDMFG